jgi:3-oxoacyl-[acyl-carrier-protein] synthase II
MARVAVTGLGAVTPVGGDVETTWTSLVAGRSGVGHITTFDARTFPVRIAGLVDDFDLGQHVTDPRAARGLVRTRRGERGSGECRPRRRLRAA